MSGLLRYAIVVVVLSILGGAACKKNSAPEAPQIQGPCVAKPGTAMTYGFTASDPDGDDVWYMVSWGDGTADEWSAGRPSGELFTQTHSYPDSGTYFVKAKAKDADDAESGWSEPIQVAVGFFAPNSPARPSGPAACTTGAACDYRVRAVHPLGDSVSIQFFWGDCTSDWGPMVASGDYYQATHTFDTLGMYRIAARARDARGLESPWSDSLRVAVDTVCTIPGAPQNLTLAAATDSTVTISWTPPVGMTPNGYVVSFRRTGYSVFDSIGAVSGTSLVHDPAGRTGAYEVTAVYDSAQYTAAQTPATTPVATSMLRVPELNGAGSTGYGWNRTTGEATLYDMTTPDSADEVDLYVTDFARGSAGPLYSIANPFLAPQDSGGIVPTGNWRIVEFTTIDTSATENDPLPRYSLSRYRDSQGLSPLPALVSCHAEDGYFALVRASNVDTLGGTADIQTWFQLVRNLRLIEH